VLVLPCWKRRCCESCGSSNLLSSKFYAVKKESPTGTTAHAGNRGDDLSRAATSGFRIGLSGTWINRSARFPAKRHLNAQPVAELFFVLQDLLEFLDPADPSLAEVDLDVAGEFVADVAIQQLNELVEFCHMFLTLFFHVLHRILSNGRSLPHICYSHLTVIKKFSEKIEGHFSPDSCERGGV
jgi:hypothetical protein